MLNPDGKCNDSDVGVVGGGYTPGNCVSPGFNIFMLSEQLGSPYPTKRVKLRSKRRLATGDSLSGHGCRRL